MTDDKKHSFGQIAWADLTVADAEAVRDFYKKVVGWNSSDVTMGDYADFCMHPSDESDPVAGICHAKGANQDLPPVWLIYLTVEDMDKSVEACQKGGGVILLGPKVVGKDRYCVIKDPAGAVCALYEKCSE